MQVESIIFNETLCKYCFSMLRDKILFVIKLQKLKKQVSFCHPSQRNEHVKMWETGYFLRWRTSYHSLTLRPSTFQDDGWVKFPTLGRFRMSNSLPTCASLSLIHMGCPPPPPCILGQTIDRRITYKDFKLAAVKITINSKLK